MSGPQKANICKAAACPHFLNGASNTLNGGNINTCCCGSTRKTRGQTPIVTPPSCSVSLSLSLFLFFTHTLYKNAAPAPNQCQLRQRAGQRLDMQVSNLQNKQSPLHLTPTSSRRAAVSPLWVSLTVRFLAFKREIGAAV